MTTQRRRRPWHAALAALLVQGLIGWGCSGEESKPQPTAAKTQAATRSTAPSVAPSKAAPPKTAPAHKPPLPSSTKAKTGQTAGYVGYTPAGAGFHMQYIHAPRESTQQQKLGQMAVTMKSGYANKPGMFQVLQYFTLPANYKAVIPQNKPSQILRNFVSGSMGNKGITKVDEERDYKHQGRAAFLYRGSNARNEGLVVRSYLDGRTVILTALVGAKGYPAPTDLATYLESFRFTKPAGAAKK